ncbi:hypothetical protein WJX74_008781 [Apatococcus lobatus]|uniref:JmjC domain-containing protein n=1 Tax=Apatococcus lobatus TaxID=904363 RepID=A0AAW1QJT4_9CHLO
MSGGDLPQASHGISALHLQEGYIKRGLPVVIRELADCWPISQVCSLTSLRTTYGNVKAPVRCSGGSWKRLKLCDFIESLGAYEGADVKPYLRTWNFLEDVPELAALYQPPRHFQDHFQWLPEHQRPPFTWLFVGPRGAATPLHVDIWHTDAWLAQLEGRKRFWLFHPKRRAELVQRGLLTDAAASHEEQTRIKPSADAFEQACKDIPHGMSVLTPGDVIYIPRGWPHQAEALEDGVSLTSNFLSKQAHAQAAVVYMGGQPSPAVYPQ